MTTISLIFKKNDTIKNCLLIMTYSTLPHPTCVYGVDSVRKFYCWCEPVCMVSILGANFIVSVTHEALAYMVLAYKVANGFHSVSCHQFLWDVNNSTSFFFWKFCNPLWRIFEPLDNLCCKLDFRLTRRLDSA